MTQIIDYNLMDCLKTAIDKKVKECPIDLFSNSVSCIMDQFMSHKSITEGAVKHIDDFLSSKEMKDFLEKVYQFAFENIETMKQTIHSFVMKYFEELFRKVFDSQESSPFDAAAVKKAYELIDSSVSELKIEGAK